VIGCSTALAVRLVDVRLQRWLLGVDGRTGSAQVDEG
jgi:hypothetical protein